MEDELNRLSREALARLSTIDPDERRQLGQILVMLADCYGDGAKNMAVLVFRSQDDRACILGVNTLDMDAYSVLQEAVEVMGAVNTAGAPAKGMFN
jgi:hypothetical protein